MALIIEDGTIVENANSFATVQECRDYAAARNLDVPAADEDVEALLIKSWDYLFSVEERFQGWRFNENQEGVFPRDNVYIFEKDVSGTIPKILKKAQCQLAVDSNTSDLQTTGAGREVKKEKVGALEVEYNPNGDVNPQINPTAAMTILNPLFKKGGGINLFATR